MIKTKQKVCCNLIMCDMYAFNPDICNKVATQSDDKYYELQVKEGNNGITEELVEVDYPYTAEYVASFEQSANYKNDVDGAIANGVKKANLGDITAYQEVLAMDSQLISDLSARLSKANDLLAKATQANVEKTTTQGENVNG